MKHQDARVNGPRIFVFFLCLLACGTMSFSTFAQDAKPVSSETITSVLTRGISVAPRAKATGHAVTTASPVISLNTILFELNSANLRPQSIQQLDEIIKAFSADSLKEHRLSIEGHTCNLGSAEHNRVLSLARANAVKEYLIATGIAPDRLETQGWGFIRPVASNATEELRTQNRRVDFIKLESTLLSAASIEERLAATRSAGGDGFVQARFEVKRRGEAAPTVIGAGAVELNSGDQFRTGFTVRQGCHVYILFLSSQGSVQWLVPTDDIIKYGKWCYFGEEHQFPGDGQWYVLDEHVGIEVVLLIASSTPLAQVERLPDLLLQHGPSINQSLIVNLVNDDEIQIQTLIINHI